MHLPAPDLVYRRNKHWGGNQPPLVDYLGTVLFPQTRHALDANGLTSGNWALGNSAIRGDE